MSITESQKIAAAFLGKPVICMDNSYGRKVPAGVDKSVSYNPCRVFCAADKQGFVILSKEGDVLAYSKDGFADGQSMPPQLIDLLKQYEAQTGSNLHHRLTGDNDISKDEILLSTPQWGQDYPYNNLTPVVGEGGWHAQTGCVATAMAIVLKYHNWPPKTYGKEVVNFYHNDIKIDFGNTTIDWDSLNEGSETFNVAVAKLMLMTGTSVHTRYEMYGSGASMDGICHELIATYSYSTDCSYIRKAFYSDADWNTILQNQLKSGLPVIYGSTIKNAWLGHTYVIDGMSGNSYHVNWGWNGNFNGYFNLDLLMPNGVDYSDHQSMVINIKPEHNPNFDKISPLHVVYGWNTTFRTGSINCTTDKIQRNVPLSVTGPVLSFQKFHGYVNFALVDENDNIIELAKQTMYKIPFDQGFEVTDQLDKDDFEIIDFGGYRLNNDAISFPLEATSLNEFTQNFVFTDTDIKPDYKLVLVSKEDGENDWKTVLGLNGTESYIPVQGIRSEYSDVEWIYDESKLKVVCLDQPLMGESSERVLRYQNDKQYRLLFEGGKAEVFINDILIDNSDFSDDYLGEYYDNIEIENEPARLMFTTDLPHYKIKINYKDDYDSVESEFIPETNEDVAIYNLIGEEIYRGQLADANLSGGIYVVKSPSRVYKIAVR